MVPQWVRSLIDASVSGVASLAQAAMERVLWVYNTVVAIGMAARNGWGLLTTIARTWRDSTFRFAGKLYGTLWYIIHVRIPSMVQDAVTNVVQWTVSVVNAIDAKLTALIISVRDWLVARLNELWDFIRRIVDWIHTRLSEVWDTLGRVRDLVFLLLTDPSRMAAWVAGALLQYVLSFVWHNADALLDLFRQRATYYAGLVAARIEQVLVRLL